MSVTDGDGAIKSCKLFLKLAHRGRWQSLDHRLTIAARPLLIRNHQMAERTKSILDLFGRCHLNDLDRHMFERKMATVSLRCGKDLDCSVNRLLTSNCRRPSSTKLCACIEMGRPRISRHGL